MFPASPSSIRDQLRDSRAGAAGADGFRRERKQYRVALDRARPQSVSLLQRLRV